MCGAGATFSGRTLLAALSDFVCPPDPIGGTVKVILSEKQVQVGCMFLDVAHVIQAQL